MDLFYQDFKILQNSRGLKPSGCFVDLVYFGLSFQKIKIGNSPPPLKGARAVLWLRYSFV